MQHPVVSQDEWLIARQALLTREKELVRLRDSINAERLALPWVKVTQDYVFDSPDGPDGKTSLADLFDGRSQLLIYHFMLGPGEKAGCKSCSFLSDHIEGALPHLLHHDVTFALVSRAPLPEIAAYKSRMGWRFPWVSSFGNSFNFDYNVSFTPDSVPDGKAFYNFREKQLPPGFKDTELPGLSAFYKDESGAIFHTYSCYARGLEEIVGTFMLLDRAPKGRNETTVMDFVRRHDEYETPLTGISAPG